MSTVPNPIPTDPGPAQSHGRLGDTPLRDYARKLRLFNAWAAPEIRQAMASLNLAGARVLDAGCGTGETLQWLQDAGGADCRVIGIDLAAAHIAAARQQAGPGWSRATCWRRPSGLGASM